MTDKQPEALIRAEELEQIGAESSLARAMAAHTIRLLYKENEALRARLAQPEPYKQPEDNRLLMQAYRAIHEKQPEPEPVAWVLPDFWNHLKTFNCGTAYRMKNDDRQPLYTALPQREWQGLTDEEYEATAEKYVTNCYFDTLKYARAIEAKLKEKNHGN